jgi:uncharacterized protein with ParB-like and HNH nuclease domain/predicted transport protein
MKATETPLLPFLEGKKQFVIPIYQRTYSWTRPQCQQLWDDIYNAGSENSVSGHFIGSVVYIQEGLLQGSGIPQLLVIDGQQRLTSLSLLLTALASAAESREDLNFSSEELRDEYLTNKYGKQDLQYKLLLTQSDRGSLKALVKGKVLPENLSPRVVENYRFFQQQISRTDLDLDQIYEGIAKLIIVDVSLDRNYDNPQLIFESLNSTGLDLSQADLVRNYILMGLEPTLQESIYEDYWHRMERAFDYARGSWHFDRFMRDYLTVRSHVGRIPKLEEVYAMFKDLVKSSDIGSIEDIVADVYKYSKHYEKIVFGREENLEIKRVLQRLRKLRVDVANPYLLEIYEDYVQGLLPRKDFVQVLRLVESYVFRRAICEIPTNSLNKTFATLSREIDRENYLNSVKLSFENKDSYRRFPKDEEFWYRFTVKDVYNFGNRNYLLDRLENHERKEPVSIEEYTIEHVLPQNENLSEEWRNELGDDWATIQGEYLHTIGNLTLTGYNPELSDHPFAQKRTMKGGFKDSPIRLNRFLAETKSWTKDRINQRAEILADLALKIWPHPTIEEILLIKGTEQTIGNDSVYSLDDYKYLEGDTLELFQYLRTRITNIDPSIVEDMRRDYIGYRTTTCFTKVEPQPDRLVLYLGVYPEELEDPSQMCSAMVETEPWSHEVPSLSIPATQNLSHSEFEHVIALITQAYEKHMEEDE